MANTINYAAAYLKKLDEVYKKGAATAILEAAADSWMVDEKSEKTIWLQKMVLQGLATYSRSNGFTRGDSTVEWESRTFSVDRGRSFDIDVMDEKEAYVTVAKLMSELMRTQIIPEIDAYRFSKLVSLCGLDASVNLTYDTAVAALDTAIQTLDDAEVPEESRVLFVSNEFYSLLKQSGEWFNHRIVTEKSTELNRNITKLDDLPLFKVPSARFKSAFTFYDGVTGGQEAGGFVPAGGAKQLNFILTSIPSIIAVVKHNSPKIVPPQYNTESDSYVFAYRVYHDLFVPDNKLNGTYIHSKA